MGRIWSIGPQQTLYVPGCWLKKGKNEIIVLDVVGPKEAVVWGQAEPELKKLQLENSNKHKNIGDKPDLNSAMPVATGVALFKSGLSPMLLCLLLFSSCSLFSSGSACPQTTASFGPTTSSTMISFLPFFNQQPGT